MNPLVSLKDVSVTRNGRRLLGPVTWQLERGRHTAVTGRNGSGKTTLLRLLRGEITPDIGGERVYDFGEGPQRTVLKS
jgi:molybdate transport system ATP-binding protein